MTWKYTCGHESIAVIINDCILTLSAYFEWSESVGVDGTMEQCWGCWNKND